MQEKHFYYSPFFVISLTAIFYLAVLLPCIFMFLQARNFLMMLFLTFVLFVIYPRLVCFTKALIRTIRKQPAITLTEDYFIDHYYGVKIEWNNVKTMSRVFYRWTFCAFDLNSPEAVYKQIKDPVIMVAVKLDSYFPKASFKTILSIIDSRNGDVFEAIEAYRKTLPADGRI